MLLTDLRSRQHRDLIRFSEAIRYIAVFYDGVVVPGAIMLLVSGAWFTVKYYGGWDFLNVPWLAGMIVLFAFEFIEGNTVTRVYFMKLRRITQTALDKGEITPELEHERAKLLPSFNHYLDMPMLFLIIALGVLKPNTWEIFFYGRLYPSLWPQCLLLLSPDSTRGESKRSKIEKHDPVGVPSNAQ